MGWPARQLTSTGLASVSSPSGVADELAEESRARGQAVDKTETGDLPDWIDWIDFAGVDVATRQLAAHPSCPEFP